MMFIKVAQNCLKPIPLIAIMSKLDIQDWDSW